MTDYSQEEKAVATISIFKMKVQQTVERIKEEHFQNTCGAEIVFEGDAYEENEEIQMEDLEQASHKFKVTQPQRKGLLQHYRNSKTALLGITTRYQDWTKA